MARKVMKQEVGTIYQKPSGTYYYRYQINGERKAISLKTKNQEEAKRKVKELLPVLKATSIEVVSRGRFGARRSRAQSDQTGKRIAAYRGVEHLFQASEPRHPCDRKRTVQL